MWTLGIESATLNGGVALLRDVVVVGEVNFERGMVHGRDLAPAIQKLCDAAGIAVRQLDLIAVDIGPGSYTGLRVGLACAKGISFATNRPIIGIVSLDAMAVHFARSVNAQIVCPALDAKWNQIYFAVYDRAVRRSGPFAQVPQQVASKLPAGATVFGDATRAFRSCFETLLVNDDPAHFSPLARVVAELGALQFAAGKSDNTVGLEPLYLRPTEAELKFRK